MPYIEILLKEDDNSTIAGIKIQTDRVSRLGAVISHYLLWMEWGLAELSCFDSESNNRWKHSR